MLSIPVKARGTGPVRLGLCLCTAGTPLHGGLLNPPPWLRGRPGSVYILTGGLGGFGQALAMYLAQHGATRLVLTSRSGIRQGAQRRLLSQLEDMGVLVCGSI